VLILRQLNYYENGGVNFITWQSIPNSTYSVFKIIVHSSRLAIWHVQFVAVSTSWLIGAYRKDVFSIYLFT